MFLLNRLLLLSAFAYAFTLHSQPTGQIQGAPLPPSLPPIAPIQPKEEKPTQEYKPTKPIEKRQVSLKPTYFHPGILIYKSGSWTGGDYLYNLSNNIGVKINIVAPDDSPIKLNERNIVNRVNELFSKAGIVPSTLTNEGEPPLPFFQIQVLIYPSTNFIAASIKGALFENVNLKRVILEKNNSFQAVTWERESLIVANPQEFEANLNKSIDETVNAFTERYLFYRQYLPK